MVRITRRSFDPGVRGRRLVPCSTRVSSPPRLPEKVSAYSQTLKRRNLWEKILQSSRQVPVYGTAGSTSRSPVRLRLPHDRGSAAKAAGIFGFAGRSLKSSWIAGEWIFVLVLLHRRTTFYRSRARGFRTNSACGLCTKRIPRTAFPCCSLPIFYLCINRAVALWIHHATGSSRNRLQAIVVPKLPGTGRRPLCRSDDRFEAT